MDNKIIEIINNLQLKDNYTDLTGIAFITQTMRQTIFYVKIDNEWHQSNNMIEEDLIDSVLLDKFDKELAEYIRNSSFFDKDKLNVITFDSTGAINCAYKENDASIYQIRKEWKSKNII